MRKPFCFEEKDSEKLIKPYNIEEKYSGELTTPFYLKNEEDCLEAKENSCSNSPSDENHIPILVKPFVIRPFMIRPYTVFEPLESGFVTHTISGW